MMRRFYWILLAAAGCTRESVDFSFVPDDRGGPPAVPGVVSTVFPITLATRPEDGPATFTSRGRGGTAFFVDGRVVLRLGVAGPDDRPRCNGFDPVQGLAWPGRGLCSATGPSDSGARQAGALSWQLAGARPVEPRAEETLDGVVNVFRGRDPRLWQTGLPTFERVAYRGVLPGVDLIVYPAADGIQYRIHAQPGAVFDRLSLAYEGATSLQVDPRDGCLVVEVGARGLRECGLAAFQPAKSGAPARISAHYELDPASPDRYQIVLGPLDDRQPLVIDPVLSWTRFLPDTEEGQDSPSGIVVGPDGNPIVAGTTESQDFPVTMGAFQQERQGYADAFVTKIAADGSGLVWSTRLGGNGSEWGPAIAIDAQGNPVIAGLSGTGFPVVNPIELEPLPSSGVYVAKLAADGSSLVWSSLLGGSDFWEPVFVAVDGTDRVIVAATTRDEAMPIAGGFQPQAIPDAVQGYVAVIAADGATLEWSSYLGGNSSLYIISIAAAADDAPVLCGYSYATGLGTPGAFQDTLAGQSDAFIAKLASDGSAVEWFSYLGASQNDTCLGLDVDPAGRLAAVGFTQSADFPVANAIQPELGNACCGTDAFVSVLSPDGTALEWSTFLGGSNASLFPMEGASAVDASVAGSVLVAGRTNSTDFPTRDPFQPTFGGGTADGFVARIAGDGSTLVWSSFMGGADYDAVLRIAVGSPSVAYLLGWTYSTDFPTVDAIWPTNNGDMDNFVAAVDIDTPVVAWATYLGGGPFGGDDDQGAAIVADGAGTVYVAGSTESGGLQVNDSFDSTLGLPRDAFVGGFGVTGSWLSYLGGSGADRATALTLGPDSRVLVAGETTAMDFPVAGGFQPAHAGGSDGFVTAIEPDGSAIAWSSLLGGAGDDAVAAVVTGPDGVAYAVGATDSIDFPASGGDATLDGTRDGFVAAITPDGASLRWSVYLGGSDVDEAADVAVGDDNGLYVVGTTASADMPGLSGTLLGDADGFVSRLGQSDAAVQWTTLVGGSTSDAVQAAAWSPSGLVIAGWTASPDLTGAGGVGPSFAGGIADGFVSLVLAQGTVSWSTYLGGSGEDEVADLAVDRDGLYHLVGTTSSSDFPVVDAWQSSFAGGSSDAFVARLAADGSTLSWSSLFGGDAGDDGAGITTDACGNAYFIGTTSSTDLPGSGSASPSTPPDAYFARVALDEMCVMEVRPRPSRGIAGGTDPITLSCVFFYPTQANRDTFRVSISVRDPDGASTALCTLAADGEACTGSGAGSLEVQGGNGSYVAAVDWLPDGSLPGGSYDLRCEVQSTLGPLGAISDFPDNLDELELCSPSGDDTDCDGMDQDCDGVADDGYAPIATSCGVGFCAASGTTSCAAGIAGDSCAPGSPAAADDSTCDGVDDDCDGGTDEEYEPMATSCGVGACAAGGATSCVAGIVEDSCVPGTAAADDSTCNGVDDDCDGGTDEEYEPVVTSCGVGACSAAGTTSCVSGIVEDSCVPGTAAADDSTCNGVDDDCDGQVDEEYASVETACRVGTCRGTGATVCDKGVVHVECEAACARFRGGVARRGCTAAPGRGATSAGALACLVAMALRRRRRARGR